MEDAIREWQETLDRGTANTMVRMNTEDWLKEARALASVKAKPISEIESSLNSYLEELGRAGSDWNVAYQSIARLGTPAIPALIRAVESGNDLLRSSSIDLLGKIGDKNALPVLEKAARMSEADFRRMTGITGKGRQVMMGGTQIEVSLKEDLDSYHSYAKGAIQNIKKRR